MARPTNMLVKTIGPTSLIKKVDVTSCGAYGIMRVKACTVVQNPVVVDLLADARAYWKVLTESPLCPPERRNLSVPNIKTRRLDRPGYKGHYRPSTHTVHISLTDGLDLATLRMILLHELAHAAAGPGNRTGRDSWHAVHWRDLYQDAAEKMYGFTCTERPRHRYGLDDLIAAHLRNVYGMRHSHSWHIPSTHPDLVRMTTVQHQEVA